MTIVSVFTMTDLPSAVYLHFGKSVLTPLESTTVNCTAVGRSDTYNLTLWKNNRLLASNSGNSLIYSTQPSQYGTYRCAVDNVHNTSLLSEEGNVISVIHQEVILYLCSLYIECTHSN